MKFTALALTGANFMLTGQALAEGGPRASECIARPGYWSYAPITCDETPATAAQHSKAERPRHTTLSND